MKNGVNISMNHNGLSKTAKIFSVVLLSLVVGACSSKKKTEDAGTAGAESGTGAAAPVIENTAMTFDANGSDAGKISGLSTINFDYDKAALSASSKEKLKANADWIKANASTTVQIEGHCDARGTIEYNLALGERRAQSVRSYLIGLGVPANRLNIISYGEERPLAKGDSDSDHAKNRRANFVPLNQ